MLHSQLRAPHIWGPQLLSSQSVGPSAANQEWRFGEERAPASDGVSYAPPIADVIGTIVLSCITEQRTLAP